MRAGPGLLIIGLLNAFTATQYPVNAKQSSGPEGCLACHSGIMQFADGPMMAKIKARGKAYGDPEGCIICHGGTPSATSREAAHSSAPVALRAAAGPQQFYPNPGNVFVAQYACGQCHAGYAQRLSKSLLGTKTETIHSDLCIIALERLATAEEPKWFGQYALQDEDGPIPVEGSTAYKQIMHSLSEDHKLFTKTIYQIPAVPNVGNEQHNPARCDACHANRNEKPFAGEHGSGCSACHVPYRSGTGYLGDDPTIDKSQPGRLLLHRLQGAHKTRVPLPVANADSAIVGEGYRGISLDNCFTCHHDVRGEDLNPMGAVMTHYGSRHEDQVGGTLLCQDCHTTIEMHGDGNIPVTTHAQMEVRCEDCHGTVEQLPWQLPLGYGADLAGNGVGKPRGLTNQLADKKAAHYPRGDGYLLTSRGNPFGNVVKDGERVLLHSASGQSFAVPILNWIKQKSAWKSQLSQQAMFEVKAHTEKMKCLSCHGDNVQPCFGCHDSTTNKEGRHQ